MPAAAVSAAALVGSSSMPPAAAAPPGTPGVQCLRAAAAAAAAVVAGGALPDPSVALRRLTHRVTLFTALSSAATCSVNQALASAVHASLKAASTRMCFIVESVQPVAMMRHSLQQQQRAAAVL